MWSTASDDRKIMILINNTKRNPNCYCAPTNQSCDKRVFRNQQKKKIYMHLGGQSSDRKS